MLLNALADRQLGLRTSFHYDTILRRLVVQRRDSYPGIAPNEERLDFNPLPPLFACRFAEKRGYEHVLALANEDGRVAIQDTAHNSTEEPTAFDGFQCHSNAVFDLVWRPDHMSFLTLSGDHSAKLWDIRESTLCSVRDFLGHNRSVRTAAFRPDDSSVFATGARDGKIAVWDTRMYGPGTLLARPVNTIHNCHPVQLPKTPGSGSKKAPKVAVDRTNSVTGLVFRDDANLISCGSGDGSIRVWDLRRNYTNFKRDPLPKHSIPYGGGSSKNGYSNLMLDKSRIKLYANCVDNVIYCFNASTYNMLPEQKYTGHENGSFYIKASLSPDSKYLVSGSSNHDAYVWNLKYGEPILRLSGHMAEVTCATWCQAGEVKIVTCSDDARHKIWRIGREFMSDEDYLECSGRAYEIPPVDRTGKSHLESLDRTPKPPKRRYDSSGEQDSWTKRSLQAFDSPVASSSRPIFQRRSSKRSLIDMLNDSLVLPNGDGEGNDESRSKKRALNAKTYEDDCVPSTSHQISMPPNLPSIPEDSVLLSAEDFPTVSRSLVEEDFKTPTKATSSHANSPCLYYYYSPNRILDSPTLHLPNFVATGKAPHLPPEITQKKNKNVDWLTKMRQGKVNGAAPSQVSNHHEDDGNDHSEKSKQGKTLLQFFARTVTKNNDVASPLEDKTNKIQCGVKRKSTDTPEKAVESKMPCQSHEAESRLSTSKDLKREPITPRSKAKKTMASKNIRSFFAPNNVENKN